MVDQVLIQIVLLGWLYMADLLENPYKGNRQYYFNLEEVNNVKYVWD